MASRAPRGRGREHPALRRGLRVDRVGTEAVVLDPVAALVHRLTGPAAEVMAELVMRGRDVADLPARLAPAVAGLRQAGVLRGDVSRRQALGTAAVGAVGIMTLSLPSAIAAASTLGGSGGGGAIADVSVTGSTEASALPDFSPSGYDKATGASGYAYRVFSDPDAANRFDVEGTGTLTVDVLVVGAGGAGGSNFGGGGGGGAVSLLLGRDTIDGDQLSVVVGKGGGRGGASGANGGASGFDGALQAGGGTAGTDGGDMNQVTSDSDTQYVGVGGDTPAGTSSSLRTGAIGWVFFSSTGSGNSGGGGGGAGAGSDGYSQEGADKAGGPGGFGFEVTGFFGAAFRLGAGGSGNGTVGSSFPKSGGGGVNEFSGAPDGTFGGGGGGGSAGRGGNGVVIVRYPT